MVTTSGGLTGSATTIATVGTQGQLLVGAGGPYTAAAGQPVTFSGSAMGAFAGLNLTYQWNFGDGASGTGQVITHPYAAPGTYPVTLVVTSTTGQTGSATTTATIGGSGVLPGAVQVSAGGPYTGGAGQPITFTATVSGALNPTVQWDFGDGATAGGPTAMHTYAMAGAYTVTLTVSTPPSLSVSSTTIATVAGGATAGTTVTLLRGCNNITITWPNGTSLGTVVGAISPAVVASVWRYDTAGRRFQGFSPEAAIASDLRTVNRLDSVFICVTAAATLTRPAS
jgi:PKD repeat protein